MLFLCEEFLLHIPCCLNVYTGSFSYTSRAVLISTLGVSLTHPMQVFSFFIWWISLTDPVLVSFFSFLLFFFYQGRLSYTSCAGLIFIWGVSLTHPVLVSFLQGEFLLHIPCWLRFYLGRNTSRETHRFYLGRNTSRAGFILMRGVSLIHPMLTLFMWGVSLTHPLLPSFLCGEFVLHILCFLSFMRGVSLTHPVLVSLFISCVSLTHPMLASFWSVEFFLQIPSGLCFSVGSFSYTSHDDVNFI